MNAPKRVDKHPIIIIDEILRRLDLGEERLSVYNDLVTKGKIEGAFCTFKRAVAKGRADRKSEEQQKWRATQRNVTNSVTYDSATYLGGNADNNEFDIEKMWNGQ